MLLNINALPNEECMVKYSLIFINTKTPNAGIFESHTNSIFQILSVHFRDGAHPGSAKLSALLSVEARSTALHL